MSARGDASQFYGSSSVTRTFPRNRRTSYGLSVRVREGPVADGPGSGLPIPCMVLYGIPF